MGQSIQGDKQSFVWDIWKHLLTTIVHIFTLQIDISLPPIFHNVLGFVSANKEFDYQVAIENLTVEDTMLHDLQDGLCYHVIKDIVHIPQDHF